MSRFTESVVEDAARAWLESFGYTIKHGPEIAPGEFLAERAAPVAKNVTTRLRGNMQKMHIAVSKKATVSEWEIVLRLRSTRISCENGLATTEDYSAVKPPSRVRGSRDLL